MALRLTSTSLESDDQPGSALAQSPSTDPDGATAHRLAARAATALSAGDVRGYEALFASTSELQDPSRRYHARKLLVEQGFVACQQATSGRTTDVLVAMVGGSLTALERDPAEPVLLNYAGVALYELWSLDAARTMFQAAQRLDPGLPYLRRNLSELKRRKRATNRPRAMHPALPLLCRRAARVAAQAQPAQNLTLSLCMIVRDEEEMLGRCLQAIAPAVDEIVIVDTGSQDGTIEIARSFGARVIEREWTGSFSDARNASFGAATGDWVIYLDADEVLVEEDVSKLRALRGQTWREAFYLVETNFTGTEDDGTAVTHSALRMFRNRPEYRFEGRLHEQIAQHLPAYIPERIHQTGVRIEHYGYLGAVRDAKEKSRRNIELLLAQRAESPPTPFLYFNLGSEYFAAGNAAAALDEFEQAWVMIEEEGDGARHEFTPSLLVRLIKALRVCQRPQDAIDRAEAGLKQFPGFTDLVFEQGAACLSLKRYHDAARYFERCMSMGDAPSRYTALVGCGTYLPRITLAEVHLGRGEVEPALRLLRWCIEHHPEFFGVIHPYASALLRAGRSPAEVVAEIEARVPRVSPTVRFMVASALFERGAAIDAEAQFRLVLGSQPGNGASRVALAETLLYQRRNAEAASEASLIGREDPLAAIALRSELFGRIAGGDLDGATIALSRASQAGLAPADTALFAAWLGQFTEAGVPHPVPVAAAPLLEVMLEALLRVQDFPTFESLHAVVGASELPLREQREMLGRTYLRRGFLKSAAREWMAVCEERPDVRSLLGLARVSKAHGNSQSAATFASEALKLDPMCEAARELAAPTPVAGQSLALL